MIQNMSPVKSRILDCIRELYLCEGCEAGGPLHIVLDDGNVRDNDILWCLKYVGDHDYGNKIKILCYRIGADLLTLGEARRAEILKEAWNGANRS